VLIALYLCYDLSHHRSLAEVDEVRFIFKEISFRVLGELDHCLKNAKEGNARRVDLSQSFVKLLVSVLWVGPVFLGFAGQVFVHLVLGGLEPVDGAGLHGRVDG